MNAFDALMSSAGAATRREVFVANFDEAAGNCWWEWSAKGGSTGAEFVDGPAWTSEAALKVRSALCVAARRRLTGLAPSYLGRRSRLTLRRPTRHQHAIAPSFDHLG